MPTKYFSRKPAQLYLADSSRQAALLEADKTKAIASLQSLRASVAVKTPIKVYMYD